MKLNEMYPSKYVKAADLDGDTVVEIKSVEMRKFDNDAQEKPVVSFYDFDKMLVLNVTNAKAIAAVHGDDTSGWDGRKITLHAEKVSFKGDWVNSVRVRPTKPAPAADNIPI